MPHCGPFKKGVSLMQSWLHLPTLLLLGIMIVAAGAFVFGAMVWLKRLRASLAGAVAEALNRQIHHGQKVEEALTLLQKNQKQLEAHMQTLAQAQARARADVSALRDRVEQREAIAESTSHTGRILH